MSSPIVSDKGCARDAVLIALVSLAVLVFEIAITRLMSVVLWYHFAFLSISLAMLALGAPGVWFSLRSPGRKTQHRCLLAAGLAIPAAVSVVAHCGELAEAIHVAFEPGGIVSALPHPKVVVAIACLLVPFLLLGSVVCMILIRAPGARVGRVYAADLLGAMVGAALVVPLLHWVPTPIALASLGFVPLAAAWIAEPRRPLPPLTVAAIVALAIAWGWPFQVQMSKVYRETGHPLLHERWTPTARLTVFEGLFVLRPFEAENFAFGWGLGKKFEQRTVEQLWVEQDGSAGTPITRFDGSLDALDHLFWDVTSVGYQLRSPESVAIVGAGGGRDILTALRAGARRVDAIEMNAAMIEIATDLYGEFSGDVYRLPGVNAIASEGRSFFARTPEDYDFIQISLIDSWAATTAGAYTFSENYLYTVEALQLYLDHLKPGGVLSISRWISGIGQLESVRLVLLAAEALRREGIEPPEAHLAVVQGGSIGTVLVSNTPFDADAIAALDRIVDSRGFTRHWPPPGAGGPAKSQVIEVLRDGPEQLEAQGLNLKPPVDDRPFFFQNLRAFDDLDPQAFKRLPLNDKAARLPRFLIAAIGTLTLLVFFAPLLFAFRRAHSRGFWRGNAYFFSIGAAFMLVEIPLLQRFVLYLGHPSYATTVVLSTLLLGAGLGSWGAARSPLAKVSRMRLLLPVAVVLANFGCSAMIERTIGFALAQRVAIACTVTVPLGFFAGFAFPVGMTNFGERDRAWFWAMNGSAGVLASVSAVALASYLGFSGVVFVGAVIYVLACALLPAARTAD